MFSKYFEIFEIYLYLANFGNIIQNLSFKATIISNALGMWSFETGLSSNEPEEIGAFEPQIGSFDRGLDHFNPKLELEMILFERVEGSNKPEMVSFEHGLIQMTRNWIFDLGWFKCTRNMIICFRRWQVIGN